MTSLEPRTSGEALGSALAIAMALFVFAANVPPRALREQPGDGMLATKFVAVNAGVRSRDGRKGRTKRQLLQRLRSGHAGGQPAIALPATFGRPNAASISRRTF